jgi:hypothetical protein
VGSFRDWRAIRLSSRKYLARAAGVSTVLLACQPDVWAAVASLAKEAKMPVTAADRQPGTREDGLAEISLSGVDLVEILEATKAIWAQPEDPNSLFYPGRKFKPGQRAIARRVYLAVARALDDVRPRHAGRPVPPIVIDDRISGTESP